MFDSLSDSLNVTLKKAAKKPTLSEKDLDEAGRDLKRALLDADVALPIVKTFVARVKEAYKEEAKSEALTSSQQFLKVVNSELTLLLGQETRELRFPEDKPAVILLFGLQGAGKTTFSAKLALHLKEQGKNPLLVAADLHRPNAVNQLKVNGEKVGVVVYAPEPGNGVGDPVAVSKSSIGYAVEHDHDVIIIDSAGRLALDDEMITQLQQIQMETDPAETLFVVDSMIGQSAVATALAFKEAIHYDGLVLTKLDGDTRGGAALSLVGSVGLPILFSSTGEGMNDLEKFHPDRIAGRILALGDVLTLIEQAEKQWDLKEAAKAAGKLAEGKFTLNDFLKQMEQMKKLGSIGKVARMLPGMGDLREQIDAIDPREVERQKAIILSMTPEERNDASLLTEERRVRIAAGAGRPVEDVDNLLERFEVASQLMVKMMSGGGMPNLRQLASQASGEQPTARQPRIAQKKGKGAKRSGNPAKRG